MIYRLQKKFITICAVSVLSVFGLIFVLLCVLDVASVNRSLDTLTDVISAHNGTFPKGDFIKKNTNDQKRPDGFGKNSLLGRETPYATRYFTVWFDTDGEITDVNLDAISSVTQEEAEQYGEKIIAGGHERGWTANFRYKVFATSQGQAVVFVDGSGSLAIAYRILLVSGGVLLASALVTLFFIFIFSRRAVQPAAESYEKQKQFVTDANHELKTPLTLILTNLDIAEAQIGKNEWLDDIRSEGERMAELVSRLVELTRMDEDGQKLELRHFSMSEAVLDMVSEFALLASERGKRITYEIEPDLFYNGNEGAVRKLLSILLDNAVKYCDENGSITVTLRQKRHPVLTVENTYRGIETLETGRLFDRFYQADPSRSDSGSFGIGLSIAKAIASKHHSEISAARSGPDRIRFTVIWKNGK